MPRYEMVAHVQVDLNDTTPDAAAESFMRDLLGRGSDAVALRGLAVWRPGGDLASAPVPPAVLGKLTDFFAGVARCAATAEEAFRVRVEEILATTPREAVPEVVARQLASVVVEGPGVDGRGAEDWESEGGAVARAREEPEDR